MFAKIIQQGFCTFFGAAKVAGSEVNIVPPCGGFGRMAGVAV